MLDKFQNYIKEVKVLMDLNTFKPLKKVVLELPLDVQIENFDRTQSEQFYQLLGQTICECGVKPDEEYERRLQEEEKLK